METTVVDIDKSSELIVHDISVLHKLTEVIRVSDIRYLKELRNWIVGTEHDLNQFLHEKELSGG